MSKEVSKSKMSKVQEPTSHKSQKSLNEPKSAQRSIVETPKSAAQTPDVMTDDIKPADKKLSVDPEEGQFLEAGGRQDFMMVNTTDTPIAVKIKCSNNAQYRVAPVYLAVDRMQISTLTVTRLPGPAKNDKLVAAYCPMLDGIKDPKEASAIAKYETKGRKCQIIRIMLKVVNADDFNVVPDPSREAVS